MMFVSTKDFEKVLLHGDRHPISEEDNRPNESNPVALFAFFFTCILWKTTTNTHELFINQSKDFLCDGQCIHFDEKSMKIIKYFELAMVWMCACPCPCRCPCAYNVHRSCICVRVMRLCVCVYIRGGVFPRNNPMFFHHWIFLFFKTSKRYSAWNRLLCVLLHFVLKFCFDCVSYAPFVFPLFCSYRLTLIHCIGICCLFWPMQ